MNASQFHFPREDEDWLTLLTVFIQDYFMVTKIEVLLEVLGDPRERANFWRLVLYGWEK